MPRVSLLHSAFLSGSAALCRQASTKAATSSSRGTLTTTDSETIGAAADTATATSLSAAVTGAIPEVPPDAQLTFASSTGKVRFASARSAQFFSLTDPFVSDSRFIFEGFCGGYRSPIWRPSSLTQWYGI